MFLSSIFQHGSTNRENYSRSWKENPAERGEKKVHKTTIIVCVDNDTCAYIDGRLCAENLKYISFDSTKGRVPHLLYALDDRMPDNTNDLRKFLYLVGCILQGWDSVEDSQPNDFTWFEAVKQMQLDLFVGTIFSMCQTEKTEDGFKARLLERFPKEIAPALHLMNTGAISLIPGYAPVGSSNNHWDSDT